MSSASRHVYLDHAATTPVDPRVVRAMQPYWENAFGNPSSLYREGRKAKEALVAARQSVAHILNCQPNEIIFTAGGTESDNLAILGVCRAWEEAHPEATTKPHIITSSIEHHAVLYACQYLEKDGYSVTYLPVDQSGLVRIEDFRSALRDDTLLVSIMMANNEVGTIQPVKELAELCRQRNIYFHTDACQAAGYLDLDVQKLGVDMLTLNGSKIYGPKGIGLLYIKQGTPIRPLIYGGGQEKNLRSGTENVPAIVGLAKALELVNSVKSTESERLTGLRDFFISQIMERIADVRLNGHPTQRLSNNINLSISGVDAESLILLLDEQGISCATGSACDSSALEPSHVIAALGLGDDVARSSFRFTLGKQTSKTDLEYTIKCLVSATVFLRNKFSH